MKAKCEKCGNEEGIKASATRRPMRDASQYTLECKCGHKWSRIKSMRSRHLPEHEREEIREFWDSLEYKKRHRKES